MTYESYMVTGNWTPCSTFQVHNTGNIKTLHYRPFLTDGIPSQRANYAENVSMTRHHHDRIPMAASNRVSVVSINTLIQRQNGCHFADDIFKCIFLNDNVWIPIKISLRFLPKGPINNIPALVQIMAWRRLGDKPLSEPMMVSLPTHICVTRPQWVGLNRATAKAWDFGLGFHTIHMDSLVDRKIMSIISKYWLTLYIDVLI